jgi:hypothetical protein
MAAAMAHLANGRDIAAIETGQPTRSMRHGQVNRGPGAADNEQHPHDVLARYQGWAAHEAVAAAAFSSPHPMTRPPRS